MRASEIPGLLLRWMPKQRWYAAKGHPPIPMGIELARLPGVQCPRHIGGGLPVAHQHQPHEILLLAVEHGFHHLARPPGAPQVVFLEIEGSSRRVPEHP